jgi:hypothetical protein
MRVDIAKPMLDSGQWTSSISKTRPEPGTCKAIVGNLIAGEKLLADSTNAAQKAILDEYEKALLADMESCGVARAVFAARGLSWPHSLRQRDKWKLRSLQARISLERKESHDEEIPPQSLCGI